MKKILLNWTHRKDCAGGAETVYEYLNKVFPNAELVSTKNLFGASSFTDFLKQVDQYIINRYKKDKNILIIRDAEVAGITDISMVPQITIFGNPYESINNLVKETNGVETNLYQGLEDDWLTKTLKNTKSTLKIATSNFIKNEMQKKGVIIDKIIPNCVDINIFKPLNKKTELRKKYGIPNKRVGIWVGAPHPELVKNFQMLLNLISCYTDIFWILITKNEMNLKMDNTKIFCNISHKEINNLHNCADFFILTSPIEGCGIAMMEAMASGLPCIISKAGYFWDFWDDRIGIQIDWKSFEEHTNAIQNINKIKTNPRQVIIDQKLDFETWKRKWEEI